MAIYQIADRIIDPARYPWGYAPLGILFFPRIWTSETESAKFWDSTNFTEVDSAYVHLVSNPLGGYLAEINWDSTYDGGDGSNQPGVDFDYDLSPAANLKINITDGVDLDSTSVRIDINDTNVLTVSGGTDVTHEIDVSGYQGVNHIRMWFRYDGSFLGDSEDRYIRFDQIILE